MDMHACMYAHTCTWTYGYPQPRFIRIHQLCITQYTCFELDTVDIVSWICIHISIYIQFCIVGYGGCIDRSINTRIRLLITITALSCLNNDNHHNATTSTTTTTTTTNDNNDNNDNDHNNDNHATTTTTTTITNTLNNNIDNIDNNHNTTIIMILIMIRVVDVNMTLAVSYAMA